jgi:hypothetical protein
VTAILIAYRVITILVDLFLVSVALGCAYWAVREVVRAVRGRFRRCSPLPRRPRPALPVDGRPLSDDEGGEAEQFAALIWTCRNVNIPEPVYGPGADRGTS